MPRISPKPKTANGVSETPITTVVPAEIPPSHSKQWRSSSIPLAVILLLGLVLRLLYLGEKSLWLDEISSVTFARLDWHNFWNLMLARESNMVFYYLLLRGWIHLGESELVLRLLSVIFGVATIGAIYVFAKDFFGRQTALLAALLLAVNGAHVRASQWIRSYSLLLLLIVLSSILLARGLQRPTRRIWILYGLVTVLAVYSHFMVGLLIAAQWISLLFLPRRCIPRKQVSTAIAAVTLFSLPAAIFVVSRNVGQLNWVANPRPLELYHTAIFLAAGGGKAVGNIFLVICVIGCALSTQEFRRIWSASPHSFLSWRYAFLFTCLFFPVLFSFLLSYWKPVFFYRYLIVSLPAFLALVARGFDLMPRRWLRALLPVAVGLSLAAVFISYRPEEDWKGACGYLLQNTRPGDATIFNGQGRLPLEYYGRRFYGEKGGPAVIFAGYPAAGSAGAGYGRLYPRVWFVYFPDFVSDANIRTLQSNLASIYSLRTERKFKAIKVTLYERPKSPSDVGP